MESSDLKMIMELMEELKEEMQYGEKDFSERLGRKKPEEFEMPMDDAIDEHEGLVAVLESPSHEDDEEEAEEQGEELDEMLEESSPEDKLKQRLLKLRK